MSSVKPIHATESACRWPIGDPRDRDFQFCGQQRAVGKPYCVNHCCIAYPNSKYRFVPFIVGQMEFGI